MPERFADGQIFSVAPAPEGQRLLSIMTDDQFESMCNPYKFPYGNSLMVVMHLILVEIKK